VTRKTKGYGYEKLLGELAKTKKEKQRHKDRHLSRGERQSNLSGLLNKWGEAKPFEFGKSFMKKKGGEVGVTDWRGDGYAKVVTEALGKGE